MEKMLKGQLGNMFRDMLVIAVLMLLFRFSFVDAMVIFFTMLLGRVMLLDAKWKVIWCLGVISWILVLTVLNYGLVVGGIYAGLMTFIAYGSRFFYHHKDWE